MQETKTRNPDTSRFNSLDSFVKQADSGGMDKITPLVVQSLEKPVPFALRVPVDLHTRIKVTSAQTGIPMHELIMKTLEEKYLE